GVAQQGDVGGAVRVVLDALDAGGDAFLVALEVDDPVVLLVAAAHVARGDAPVVVAAAGAVLLLGQRRVRVTLVELVVDDPHHPAAACRSRLVVDQCHGSAILRLSPSRRCSGPRPGGRRPCASRRGGPAGNGRSCSCPSRSRRSPPLPSRRTAARPPPSRRPWWPPGRLRTRTGCSAPAGAHSSRRCAGRAGRRGSSR